MSCGIYKIENQVNQKVYIGQSTNIATRWRRHRSEANNLNNSYPLYRAMRKYGLENFSFEIIEECSREDLDSRERYWIKKFDSYYNGYNQTSGGQNGGASISLQSSDVLEIIELLKTTTLGNQEIAKEYNVSENTICGINTGYYWFQDDIDYPIRKPHCHVCQKCGKAIKNTAKYCSDCLNSVRRVCERPSRDELKRLIRSTPFTKIGEQFGVTDNSIRKWCVAEGLPSKVKDIKTYSDEEWENV